MKKTLILAMAMALTLIAFASCSIEKPLTRTPADNNSTFTVNYLFEHDGVKVYRFEDGNRYVYFTSPAGLTTSMRSDSLRTAIQTMYAPGTGKTE